MRWSPRYGNDRHTFRNTVVDGRVSWEFLFDTTDIPAGEHFELCIDVDGPDGPFDVTESARACSLTGTLQVVGTAAFQFWLYNFGCTSVFKNVFDTLSRILMCFRLF